jgi:hypothetical protein
VHANAAHVFFVKDRGAGVAYVVSR